MDEKVTDEQFRRNLIEYFRFSEKNEIMEEIIYHPRDFKIWFQVLYDNENHLIDVQQAENKTAKLQRYLESYRNNTGFNFLCGMLRIISGKFINTEGEWRFREALQNIKDTFLEEETMEILNMTLDNSNQFSEGRELKNKI